jgi:hypothetical protein
VFIINIKNTSLLEAQQAIEEHGIENIALEFERRGVIHVGALCYRKRSKPHHSSVYEVCEKHLDPKRVLAISAWVKESITDIKTGNLSENTFASYVGIIFQLIKGSERDLHFNLFDSEEKYALAYRLFSDEAYQIFASGKNTAHTAQIKQSYPLAAATKFFPDSEYKFPQPHNKINLSLEEYNTTETPLDSEIAHATASCSALFRQLTDALLKRRKYPFQITFQNHDIWVVPNKQFCKPKGFESYSTSESGWNYETGKVDLLNEKSLGLRLTALELENRCAASNTIGHHHYELARWAHNCFLQLFTCNTGMNEEQILDLEWSSGHYEIVPHVQGFRTVKCRAGNKAQSFIITTDFVKDFEEYLRLREYILDGSNFTMLFMFIPLKNRERGFKPLQIGALTKLYHSFRQVLDPKFPNVGYRKLRLYKYNYLLTNYGVAVANQLMQSSLGTIAKAYSSAEEGKATREISAYYNLFSETVSKYQESIPPGHCAAVGNPSSELIDIVEAPVVDCKDFITCLFCTNFVAHATETDARKLVSLKYFLNEIRSASASSKEFEKINGPTIHRINKILEELTRASDQFKDILKQVEQTVNNNEQLSDYWGALLDKIVKFGGIQ